MYTQCSGRRQNPYHLFEQTLLNIKASLTRYKIVSETAEKTKKMLTYPGGSNGRMRREKTGILKKFGGGALRSCNSYFWGWGEGSYSASVPVSELKRMCSRRECFAWLRLTYLKGL